MADDIEAALRRTDLFGSLSPKALRAIARQARPVQHPAGKEITEQGGSGHGFHLITEGRAEVTVKGERRADLGPGDYFGEISLIDGQPRSATVTAVEPMTTISLTSWAFKPVLDEQPEVTRALLNLMVKRLRAAEA